VPVPSDVIEAHVRRLPRVERSLWTPRTVERADLERALMAAGVAGVATHPLDNVRGNVQMLLDRDPDKEFGLSGLQEGMTLDRVLGLVEDAAGAPIDRDGRYGPVEIRPEAILDACEATAPRLARARRDGERVLLATGHPTGLAHLYHELARDLADRGARVEIPPAVHWRHPGLSHDWVVDHWDGVAIMTDGREPRHTHWPFAMQRILEVVRPHLVFADHGFAGAAIEAGIETMSIADVNDPALLVARAQGRTDHVLVFDDHVDPNAYWPVFVALTA
jgi:histidinol phosphate phosphatase hisN-like protein